jgi:hypothetical protein
MASTESLFMKENVSRLLSRYELRYYQECNCMEYFITDKGTGEQISYSIVLSLNTHSREIHVNRFCPKLYKESVSPSRTTSHSFQEKELPDSYICRLKTASTMP